MSIRLMMGIVQMLVTPGSSAAALSSVRIRFERHALAATARRGFR
jgi:hypothetical protein